jgi:hypothetical protein
MATLTPLAVSLFLLLSQLFQLTQPYLRLFPATSQRVPIKRSEFQRISQTSGGKTNENYGT